MNKNLNLSVKVLSHLSQKFKSFSFNETNTGAIKPYKYLTP